VAIAAAFFHPKVCGNITAELEVCFMSVEIGSFITCTPGIVGGRPRIAGTRVPVQAIAVRYKQGASPEEIAFQYGHLSAAQVYAALTYYHANREEIDIAIGEDDELYDRLAREDRLAKQAAQSSAEASAERLLDVNSTVLR
jgi:uncharacterized protein (DUF433 family)